MATTTVRLPAPMEDTNGGGGLVLTMPWGNGKRRVRLPWLPEEIERGGFARTWEQQARPGRDPLMLDTGGNLRTHTFTVRVCTEDIDERVDAVIDALIDAADNGKLVTATLGDRWLGDVRITGLTVRESLWGPQSNPWDATVDMELTEAKDAPSAVGPVLPLVRGRGRNMARRS